jgi:hypothetical protein
MDTVTTLASGAFMQAAGGPMTCDRAAMMGSRRRRHQHGKLLGAAVEEPLMRSSRGSEPTTDERESFRGKGGSRGRPLHHDEFSTGITHVVPPRLARNLLLFFCGPREIHSNAQQPVTPAL